MIYLYWHLGIGAALIVLIYGAHRVSKRDEPKSLHDLLDAVNPERKKLSYRFLINILASTLGAVAVVVLWPIVVYMNIKDAFSKKNECAIEESRKFAVEPGHLQERLSVQEIEAREIVLDPMGAVPNLPFGHLNSAWRTFVDCRSDDDELWSFAARSQTTWGQKELRTGYVLVRYGHPGAHFLTLRKQLSENDGTVS